MKDRKAIKERMIGLVKIISNLTTELAFCRKEEEEWYRNEIGRMDKEYELLKGIYYGKTIERNR